MEPGRELGRLLLIVAAVLAIVGLLLTFGSKLPFRLGRLPGDIVFRRDNFAFYLPIATSVLLSVLLTTLLWLFSRRP